MIPRYTRPQMAKIWSDENKFSTWLRVETVVCEVLAEMDMIPADAVNDIKEKAQFDIRRILEIEKTVKHDVIAFLTNVGEHVGEASRYIHLGLTSSDLLDTSNALLMREAGEVLLDDLERLRTVLKRRALEHKNTACIGRSHGIHAEPTTFGFKLALWYDEVGRGISRLQRAIETISVGKVSGAVGTFAHLDPPIEEMTCKKLNLKPAPVSTQIVQRDRYAEYLTTLALIAATLEKIAVEIRHLQRTEVREAEEYFSPGQKGSSSMPHKRNPIICERISGMARLLRGNALVGMENVALWHERDISHSSVERVILPDSTTALDYMLDKTINLIDKLLVYPENMKINLGKTRGLIFSQGLLLKIVQKGVLREDAYKWVQDAAMEVWKSGVDFKEKVFENPHITKVLTKDEIESCFDLKVALRNVDYIFTRVGLR